MLRVPGIPDPAPQTYEVSNQKKLAPEVLSYDLGKIGFVLTDAFYSTPFQGCVVSQF